MLFYLYIYKHIYILLTEDHFRSLVQDHPRRHRQIIVGLPALPKIGGMILGARVPHKESEAVFTSSM